MMCGSAFKNKGVQAVLDAVCTFLPSPMDIEAIEGTNPRTEEPETRKPEASEPFAALAFKIATDPYVGRLCFFRVYSGRLDGGSYIYNARSGKKERISRLMQMHSNKQNPIDFIEAGDIGAGVGFKDIRTGDTLCDEKNPIILESIDFPDPVIGLAVEPKSQKDLDKLGIGLSKLAEEDPTLHHRLIIKKQLLKTMNTERFTKNNLGVEVSLLILNLKLALLIKEMRIKAWFS